MIKASIVKYNEFSYTGSDESDTHDGCKNTIRFDSENLIIESQKDGDDLCTILFEITPQFIKELRTLVAVIETHYDSFYDDE